MQVMVEQLLDTQDYTEQHSVSVLYKVLHTKARGFPKQMAKFGIVLHIN
jgi:hypothetical protein